MSGFVSLGGAGIIGGGNLNDAVRLWDGVDTTQNANASRLQGTNLNPISDNWVFAPSGTLSFWIRSLNTHSYPFGMSHIIDTFQTDGDGRGASVSFVNFGGNWKIRITATDTAGSPLVNVERDIGSLNNGRWQHFLISFNVFSPTNSYIEIAQFNGFTQTLISRLTFNGNGDVPSYFKRGFITINRQRDHQFSLYDFYYNAVQLDLSDINNRRKFIAADNKPVNLGAQGQRPTGVSPNLFFSGSFNNWLTNKGQTALANSNKLTASNLSFFTKSPDKPA